VTGPAHPRDQRALVRRDIRWGTWAATGLVLLAAAVGVGHGLGAAIHNAEPSMVLLWAVVAVAGGGFAASLLGLFTLGVVSRLDAGAWSDFYPRYVRLARWHRRGAS
jgi:hypothetical protein